jgi:hypothetical protein
MQCNYVLNFKNGLAMVTIVKAKKTVNSNQDSISSGNSNEDIIHSDNIPAKKEWMPSEPFAKEQIASNTNKEINTDLLYGFIDRHGKQIVPIKNLDATEFSEGLAYIMNPDERGYIDTTGKLVLKMEETVGYEFSEGMAAVSNAQFKVGFINKQGKLMVNYLYDEPTTFSEGKAKVNIDELFGFINRNGDIKIALQYDDVKDFHENRSFAGRLSSQQIIKWALIDTTGKLLTDYIFKYVRDFSEGKAAVLLDSLWYYIDFNGNDAINAKFNYAECFVNGLAWASIHSKNKYGFINQIGKYVFTIPKPDKAIDLRLNRAVR